MARQPRLVVPGVPLHLIQRGNNRTPVFLAPEELRTYRALLREATDDSGCALHAYVLMRNHVHLLVTPADAGGAARLMKMLSQSYARWFNLRHERTGTLWEGRYRSALIDSERYLLTCHRYIELNPVRAKIAAQPADYAWSSVHFSARGVADALITPHPRYLALGTTTEERLTAYRGLLTEPLDDEALATLRRGTHTRTAAGAVTFVEPLARRFGRALPPRAQGGDRRSEGFRWG